MDQFDIKEFAQMFDAALASDNPSVQKALRNFMMIAAIVHAEEDGDERVIGPLETLVKKVVDLERMVYELQNNRTYKDKNYQDYYNNPTWVYNTSTTSGTPYISGINVDKVWADEYDTIKDYLKDMKIK